MDDYKIFFRAFKLDDAKFINDLRNIEGMESLTAGNMKFVSPDRERKWVEDIIYSDFMDRFYLAICEKGSDKMIGYLSVDDIDHYNKSCSWSGVKIHPEYQGKKYASEAAKMVQYIVFMEMNMERLSCLVLEDNIASRRLVERAGYKKDGIFRNSIFKNGRYNSQLIYSILKDEYLATRENSNV
jgi:RimJ/RimL family protein N-acetyltransferase